VRALHDLTALEQAAAIRRGEISPVELTEHYLERIERIDPSVGAYVTVTAERAREEARAAEHVVRDAADPEALPPLLGVPVPVKDLTLVEGVRCGFGSAAYDGFVAPIDDHVVTLLEQAGTVLLGKTNVPEFGLPCYTESLVAPPARTPWDTTRSAGGSSGGAAAAVAAGLAPIAQGNDGGGSVRTPASVCGLVGLKVSRGRISNGPRAGDLSGLAWHGPIARTVADAAALLDVMAVPMPGDPHWAPPLPAGESFLGWARRDPGRLRIGRFRVPVIAETELHPECVAAYESASALLAGLGHEVVDVDPPFGPDATPAFETVWWTLAASAPVEPDREELLMPLTRWQRERGRASSGAEFVGALAAMQALTRSVVAAWGPYDAILTPTLAQLPAPIGSLRNDNDPAAGFEAEKRFTPYTSVYNITGQPAITLPLHWSADGLPIGVMLAGRPAGEAQLLALAGQVEHAADWTGRHPGCW
jgi:amidase